MKNFLYMLSIVTLAAACSSNNNKGQPDLATTPSDMAVTTADLTTASQPDMTPACVMNPTTHDEYLNACTDADSYDKQPFYPTLAPNGQLPPLP